MRYEDIPEAERPLVAFHHSHWTKKVDDDPAKAAPGRWLMDCKSINDDFTKAAAIKRYGRVVYPTISSILAKWLESVTDLGVKLADCRISKDDVESAFAQFDFAPESAMLLGQSVGRISVLSHHRHVRLDWMPNGVCLSGEGHRPVDRRPLGVPK